MPVWIDDKLTTICPCGGIALRKSDDANGKPVVLHWTPVCDNFLRMTAAEYVTWLGIEIAT